MANDLAELRAEVSALRALVLTMAPMVFGQEGLSAENVEALGAAFAKQIQGINIADADPEILQRMRDLKAGAVADLFSDAADQVRARATRIQTSAAERTFPLHCAGSQPTPSWPCSADRKARDPRDALPAHCSRDDPQRVPVRDLLACTSGREKRGCGASVPDRGPMSQP